MLKMSVEGHYTCHCCSGVFPAVNSLLVALTADTKLQTVEKVEQVKLSVLSWKNSKEITNLHLQPWDFKREMGKRYLDEIL